MRKVHFLIVTGILLAATVACTSRQATPTSNVPTLAVTSTPLFSPTIRPTTAPGEATCRAVPPIGVAVEGVPSVSDQDWVRGPADAPVTLIEYADFQ